MLLAAAVTTFSLSSCNGDSVKIAKALEEKNYDYEGKQIELIGEFDAPMFTFGGRNSKTLRMAFIVKSHAMSSEKHRIAHVVLPTGEGKNSVTLEMNEDEKNYTLKNFNIYDQSGEKYNLDTHPEFKIKGTVHYSEMKRPENERDNDNFAFEVTDVIITKK